MDYADKLPPSPWYIFAPPPRYIFPPPLTDITEGYAADWTMEQLRDAAQRIVDRLD